MTKDDFKTEMQKTGISPAVTEKLSEIIESSDTPCEAMNRVHAFCPQFEIDELQKQFDLVSQQAGFSGCEFSEGTFELTEDELDCVTGGWCGWKNIFSAALHIVAEMAVDSLLAGGVGVVCGGSVGAVIGMAAGATVGLITGIVDVATGKY